ncbi:MAG: hypothetical protein IPJ19_07760 [Planctomycetes bacterium]|nr:hypothetical protein [Planctomycetota bacterium]
MSASVGFVVFLLLTLACLAGAVSTGLRAWRRRHLACVAGAVACLVATIYYALALGHLYDLDAAGWITPVHKTMAKVATASYLLPVVSGVRTIFHPPTRRLHRKIAFLVLSLTIATALTGTWMLLASPRLPG